MKDAVARIFHKWVQKINFVSPGCSCRWPQRRFPAGPAEPWTRGTRIKASDPCQPTQPLGYPTFQPHRTLGREADLVQTGMQVVGANGTSRAIGAPGHLENQLFQPSGVMYWKTEYASVSANRASWRVTTG